MIMDHETAIGRIRNLKWATLSPLSIAFVSLLTAREFAESLRLTLATFPDSATLQTMAHGEIDTENLRFGTFSKRGDHADFLQHFLAGVVPEPSVTRAYESYRTTVAAFDARERAMTIVSREQQLPGIFSEILAVHDWNAHGMGFYRYYLERHIELDTAHGGHGDLMTEFSGTEHVLPNHTVLDRFWSARLALYEDALGPTGSRT